jgi:hypothetical protein
MRVMALLLVAGSTLVAAAQPSLYTVPPGVETRWASHENPTGEAGKGAQGNGGRKGNAAIQLRAGDKATLAEVHGSSGTVRRIWATLNDRSPAMLRGLKIEMFWDDSKKPAVSAPFGDFFGMGLGHMAALNSALLSSPGRSFNCAIPMPFQTGMKIVVTNESGKDLMLLFYDVEYTVGDTHGNDDLYFHAHFQHEAQTTLQRDFEILPQVQGRGRFLGTSVGVRGNRELYGDKWWGEGEVKMYMDGDRAFPTLVGTGIEDYIGDAWGMSESSNLYQGASFVDPPTMQYVFYRFHVTDPVYFKSGIRVTAQQMGFQQNPNTDDPIFKTGQPVYKAGPGLIEMEHDKRGTFERHDEWSAVAYFYLDRPENELPAIESAAARMAGMARGGPVFNEFH